MKTILVCGGRNYNDRRKVYETLDAQEEPFRIIHGAARGADSLAADYARDRNIPATAYPADWRRHGSSAGYVRNRRMLEEGRPDLVIAFPGGRGTAHMAKTAREAGVPVIRPS